MSHQGVIAEVRVILPGVCESNIFWHTPNSANSFVSIHVFQDWHIFAIEAANTTYKKKVKILIS